jgi:hypothetical protein
VKAKIEIPSSFFQKKSLLKFVTEILELFLDNGMTNIPALTGREAIAV